MSAAELRLVTDDGVPHELERLRREVASLKRMLQQAFEDAAIKDETIKKYHRESSSLKARLTKQQKLDAQDELVTAIFEFWRLMTFHPRAQKGSDRVKAINLRISEGATPRDFFKAIVGGAYDPYVDKKGKRHDGLVLMCNQSEKFEARIQTFYTVPDVRAFVDDAGAVDAARALMGFDPSRRQRADDRSIDRVAGVDEAHAS
jgi:hypothetical protein